MPPLESDVRISDTPNALPMPPAAASASATARPAAPLLPADADALLRMAAQSFFDTYARVALGMLVVDRSHRIVWISDGYRERFLPALGHVEADFVGRPVEEVVPNTLMAQVVDSGRPMLVDLLTNPAGTFSSAGCRCATPPAR